MANNRACARTNASARQPTPAVAEITVDTVERYFAAKEAELRKKMRYLKRQNELRGIELGAVIQCRIDFRRAIGASPRLP